LGTSNLPVAELRKLLSAVSEHGNQQLAEVEADLMQTNFLLCEAIEKLSNSFMAIHETSNAQLQAIAHLLGEAGVAHSVGEKLHEYQVKIEQEVHAAVTGLQFQDMTNQLITRAIKRVDGLNESLQMLAKHGAGMHSEHEHEEIVCLLKEMSSHISTRHDALNGGLRKSVAQQDMVSGEIELF